jgi:hypothetical protein
MRSNERFSPSASGTGRLSLLPLLTFLAVAILAPAARAQPPAVQTQDGALGTSLFELPQFQASTAPAPAPGLGTISIPASEAPAASNPDIIPVGCSTCGSGLLAPVPPPPIDGDGIPCATGCSCATCYPGQIPCDCCGDGASVITRFLGGLYKCICCPDPCYVPSWRPLANNAFFVPQVKPITQINIRGDFASDFQFPDKAEFFWAQENAKGPHYIGPPVPPGAKPPGSPSLHYREGFLYMEGAVDRFSIFTSLPYLNVMPILYPGASGFSDMIVGTKSLLVDCELVEFTYQFQTFIPTGNFTRGLGTGHVSLENSLIWAVKMTQMTYWQAQVAYLFPIGGTPGFQGPIFHYHLAINQMLWQCGCEKAVQLIGSAELGGYEIAGGAYTSPVNGLPMAATNVSDIVNVGPGLRLVVCNKIDLGGGSYFAISKNRMAAGQARIEFRWRF